MPEVRPAWKIGLFPSFILFLLFQSGISIAQESENRKITLSLAGSAVVSRPLPGQRPGPDMMPGFLARYPWIEVVPTSNLRIEGGAGESNELLAIAGGSAPHVFQEQMFGRKVQTYAAQGFFAPLDDFLKLYEEENGYPYEGCIAPPSIWEAGKYQGKFYAVPWTYYTLQLFWRKDHFRAAGINPEVAPRDWDEMFKIGMALSDPTGEIVVAGKRMTGRRLGFLQYGRAWVFTNYIWSAGGRMVRPHITCPECKYLIPIRDPKIDFRADHIRVRAEEYYYEQGIEEHIECARCGRTVVEHRVEDWLRESPDNKLEWRMVVNEPEGIRAFEFYRKLIHQPWTRCLNEHADREFEIGEEDIAAGNTSCPVCGRGYTIDELRLNGRLFRGVAHSAQDDDPGVVDQFAQGRVSMMMCWPAMGAFMERGGLTPDIIGTSPMPGSPGGVPANFIAGGYMAINSQADPETQLAAWRYISYITGTEALEKHVRHAVENNEGIFVWPSRLKRFGHTDVLREIPEMWVSAEEDLMRYARAEPYCPGFQTVYAEIDKPLIAIEENPNADIQKIADEICAFVNNKHFREPTPDELRGKTIVTTVLLGIMAVLFLFVVLVGIRGMVSGHGQLDVGGRAAVRGRGAQRRKTLYAALLMAPALLSVAIWAYIPLIQGAGMAFYDYRLVGDSRFIGVLNFVNAIYESRFWETMLRTLYYVVLSIGMGFLVPIVLAMMLHEVPRGKMLFRTLYYLPAVTAGLITIFLWKRLLYDPTAAGILNRGILSTINPLIQWLNGTFGTTFAAMQPLRWLQDRNMAMLCIIIPGIWGGAGPGCLIYLAALKGVPEEEYEAAEIDGASLWKKFWHITVPNLSALIIINFVGAVIGSFQAMQNIFVMTGGGPARATHTIGMEIWFNAFLYLKFGYATAMAWILGSLLIGFTIYQLQILKKVQFRASGAGGV